MQCFKGNFQILVITVSRSVWYFVKISCLERRKANRTRLASSFSVFQYIFYKTRINPTNSPLPNPVCNGILSTKTPVWSKCDVSSFSTFLVLHWSSFQTMHKKESTGSSDVCGSSITSYTSKKTGYLSISCWCSDQCRN